MKKTKEVRTGALVATAAAAVLAVGCQEQTTQPQVYTGPPTEVTVTEYPKDLPYANAYQPGAIVGGGGDHHDPLVFFSGVDFMPYPVGGGYSGGIHSPAVIGSARVSPYTSGVRASARIGGVSGFRAYSPTSPGARAAASIARGGFGGRAGSFSVGG